MPKRLSHRCIAKRCVAALQGREASRSDRSKTTVRSTSAQTRRQSSPTSIMPVFARGNVESVREQRMRSPLPYLLRSWARYGLASPPCHIGSGRHICAGTRLTAAHGSLRSVSAPCGCALLQRSAASTSGNSTCTCRRRTACHSPPSFCEYNTLHHDATPNNSLQQHATLERHTMD